MDERLLHDAKANLDGANSIIMGIRASGGHRFYEDVKARTGMTGTELEDYIQGAAATFRRVAIESSVAVFLFKHCALHERTFETFRDLVQETIETLAGNAKGRAVTQELPAPHLPAGELKENQKAIAASAL
jgi:hypothetical protein